MRKGDRVESAFVFIVVTVLAVWIGIMFGGITGEAVSGTCECTTSATVEINNCEEGYLPQCNGPVSCFCVEDTTPKCTGSVTYNCDGEESQSECNQLDECYWHFATYCTPTPCANFTDSSSCGAIAGCSWQEPQPECGNGIIEQNEECDDGNFEGPGCSSTCTIETNYRCIGEPSYCTLQQTDSNETDNETGNETCVEEAFNCTDSINGTLTNYCINDSMSVMYTCGNNDSCVSQQFPCAAGYSCSEGLGCIDITLNNTDQNQSDNETNGDDTIPGELICHLGCESNGNCYPVGGVIGNKYCTSLGTFVNQKTAGSSCSTSLECISGVCEENVCGKEGSQKGILKKFKAFIRKIFGRD